MKSPSHEAHWAEQLRAIHQAFAQRESTMSEQLRAALAELEPLRSRLLELLPQQGGAVEGSVKPVGAESAAVHAHPEDDRDSPLKAELLARLIATERIVDSKLEASLGELRQSELARLQDGYEDRLRATEQAYRSEIERMRAEARLAEQKLAQSENSLRNEMLRSREAVLSLSQSQAVREQEAATHWLALQTQFNQSRSLEGSLQHEQLTIIENMLSQQERAWGLLTTSVEAVLREQVENERAIGSRVQRSLQDVQRELAGLNDSSLRRLVRFWRGPVQPAPGRSGSDSLASHEDAAVAGQGPELRGAASPGHVQAPETFRPTPPPSDLPMNHSPDTSGVAESTDELLSFYDESFVACAYRTILGREPDPSGFKNYLTHVRNGASKARIVAELACSAEGRQRAIDLPGLRELIARDPRRSRSIWAKLKGLALAPGEGRRRQMRMIDSRLHAVEQGIARQSRQLSEFMTGLRQGSIQLGNGTSALADSAANAGLEGRKLRALSPRAAKIHSDLISAIDLKRG